MRGGHASIVPVSANFGNLAKIGAELAVEAAEAGVVFRAVAADAAYGDQDNFRAELRAAGLPFVMVLKPRRGVWQYHADAYTSKDAASIVTWGGPDQPGDWTCVDRVFHDRRTERWWAAEARLGWWGPDGTSRLVAATADPAALPDKNAWYLATDLPHPGSPCEADSPHPAADRADIVRIYGVRPWIEQGYKQIKGELGWADFQVRSATAIHCHQALVCCAFSFCWDTFLDQPAPADSPAPPTGDDAGERGSRTAPATAIAVLAQSHPSRPFLAETVDRATPLVERLIGRTPATRDQSPDRITRGRKRTQPIPSALTNHR
ncbi:MAG: hypothetical protein HOW97_10570 [Catenulispora sp.]|nr:hypothetical protein [Catenulispora sp.]